MLMDCDNECNYVCDNCGYLQQNKGVK